MNHQGKYEKIATEVGKLVDKKNQAYGNSFTKAGEYLKILYPDGIPPEKYMDVLVLVRLFDKLMRVATKNDPFGEDPFEDIAGYALLGMNNRKQERAALEEEYSKKEPPSNSKQLTFDFMTDDDTGGYRGADCD